MSYPPNPDLLFSQLPADDLVFGAENTVDVAQEKETDLVFSQKPATTDLVFGASTTVTPAVIDAQLVASVGALRLSALVAPVDNLQLIAALPGPMLSAELVYKSYAARPVVGKIATDWQIAEHPEAAGTAVNHQAATALPIGASSGFQPAARVSVGIDAKTPDSLVHAHTADASRHAEAKRLSKSGGASSYADTMRNCRGALASGYQAGAPVRHARASAYQDAFRDRRASAASRFALTLRQGASFDSPVQNGKHRDIGWTQVEQNAWVPRPGIYTPPTEPPVPARVGSPELLFWQLANGTGNLIFYPDDYTEPTAPLGQIVVPVRRAYLVINDAILVRADDSTPIHATALSVSFDADSWLPNFSATVKEASLDAVMPSPGPVEVKATINGTEFRFYVESIRRNRAFGQKSVTLGGRGIACELDAPYAAMSHYVFTGNRTAQQLIDDALIYTGYSQAWGITDWFVPGGTFSVSGTPISVAAAVAEASGSVLAAHWSNRSLRMMPRYKVKPWEWNTTMPDIILPADVVQTDSLEWSEKPDYNAVFVSGVTNGVIGRVKKTGTAGDVVAPMVAHPLITHADAARQKGISLLSDTGRKASLQLSMPVLPATGIIDIGMLIQFNDGASTRRGIVRGNNINVDFPSVRQTLSIEAQA